MRPLTRTIAAALLACGLAACAPSPVETPKVLAPVPAPVLDAHSSAGGSIRWETPLKVDVANGTFENVFVTDGGGDQLAGTVVDGTWTSSAFLVPGTTYRVAALVRDGSGALRSLNVAAHTTHASRVLHAILSPLSGTVVGVGLPAIVDLDRPVFGAADRAAVEKRLTVVSNPPVQGAWRWMSPSELHYRGPSYWKKGTTLHVHANLTGLRLSHGVWGEGVVDIRYSVGSAIISTVDVAKKIMTVTVDGKVVRIVKVSTGRDKYPTKGGVHLVLEKIRLEVMDSLTVGIPRNSPDGYYEKVPYSVRISYGGAFVHSASWSVQDQGVRNVSHGCVNISPDNAAWFFGLVKRGDIVDVINAKAPPLLSDPGMSDWNIPFSEWAN